MNTTLSIMPILLESSLAEIFTPEEWAMLGGGIVLWIVIALFGALYAFFIRIYIAYKMAKNRHRDPLPWVLLSFFVSPLLTWIILICLGDAFGKPR